MEGASAAHEGHPLHCLRSAVHGFSGIFTAAIISDFEATKGYKDFESLPYFSHNPHPWTDYIKRFPEEFSESVDAWALVDIRAKCTASVQPTPFGESSRTSRRTSCCPMPFSGGIRPQRAGVHGPLHGVSVQRIRVLLHTPTAPLVNCPLTDSHVKDTTRYKNPGVLKGPRGPLKGPLGPFRGSRGPLKGPRGPFKGPRGPSRGPGSF